MTDGSSIGASASIDTDGNYSLGIGAGNKTFQAGIGMSGNINSGDKVYSIGAGLRASNGITMGLGASFNENGLMGAGASLGFSNRTSGNQGQAGSAGISTSNFSSGDWEVKSKGFYIPIQVAWFTFGFGRRKVTYSLQKAYSKYGYGILYGNQDADDPNNDVVDTQSINDPHYYNDFQNRYRYLDAYDQTLPVTEEEFVGDYDPERQKINFTFGAYDNYDVSAPGIAGMMGPKVLDNATIFGIGYQGTHPVDSENYKQKIYYHNSLTSRKTFGKNAVSDIEFYFDGQFAEKVKVEPLSVSNWNAQSIRWMLSERPSLNNARLKQGNYIEVFTNKQIKNSQANGLLAPLDPASNGVDLVPLSRNSQEYVDNGIGGYKITAPDGKVYHFSQPVYHFERVERTNLKAADGENVSEKRQYSPYATHWLLTAITGPDFVDTNNNNIADSEDYGYWVRMDFGKWSDGFVWRNPTDKNLFDYSTNIKEQIQKEDFGHFQFGRKQLYYLDRVVSATHTAYFVKNLRFDSSGCDLNYTFKVIKGLTNEGAESGLVFPFEPNLNYKKQLQLVLEKIVLVNNKAPIVSKGDPNHPLRLNDEFRIPDYEKTYQPGYRSSQRYAISPNETGLMPGGGFYEEYGNTNILINNESGVYDIKDFQDFNYDNAYKIINFEYDYTLAVKDHTNDYLNPQLGKSRGAPDAVYHPVKNPNAGRLCLKSVSF